MRSEATSGRAKIYVIIEVVEVVPTKSAIAIFIRAAKTKGEYVVADISTPLWLNEEIITAVASTVSVIAVSVCVQPHIEHVGCR